jgi:hypothetical protein
MWGPAALPNFMNPSSEWPPKGSGSTNASDWGLTEVTAGMIAMCGTYVCQLMLLLFTSDSSQARFALSADNEFKIFGHTSSIEYRNNFFKYVHYLRTGLDKRSKPIVDLFKEWNLAFFKDRITTGASKEAQADFDDALGELDTTEKAASASEDDEQEQEQEHEDPQETENH